jgi:hypothetical protein
MLGAPRTGDSMNTSARPRRKVTSLRSKTSSRSTMLWSTAAMSTFSSVCGPPPPRPPLHRGDPLPPWNQNPDGAPRRPKDDLVELRRLIEKHGYLHRKEELEDAEAAASNSPAAKK